MWTRRSRSALRFRRQSLSFALPHFYDCIPLTEFLVLHRNVACLRVSRFSCGHKYDSNCAHVLWTIDDHRSSRDEHQQLSLHELSQ